MEIIMGKFLGSHTGEELDRPDLNNNCPLCGKMCPEEMRAGNRKPIKKPQERNSNAGRVTFVPWYHSWWFIILSFFIFSPIVALVLLLTSPHKKSHKITAVILVGVWVIIVPLVLTLVFPLITNLFEPPLVDGSMEIDDYLSSATKVTPEEYYRLPESYYDKNVIIELKVISKLSVSDYQDVYDYNTITYFLCEDANNDNVTILVRDCLLEGYKNPLPGDVIKVYGKAAGEIFVTSTDNQTYELPSVNMACVEIIE